ncbi:MAG: preprotein translocase subunit TatA [Alphaproteobacteria bacterium]|nr:preprotein translocase subunit TatA [Alphaproteobacteria bacterium]MBM3641497.1 preprotein translocase subunit TatA [Alphaproteobacteria bacterium]
MFDLEPGKLIVIAIVALIAIPSKDLPRVLRTLGQVTGKMRRMAAEFQGQFMEAMREAELEDLRKEVSEMRDAVKESVKLDGAFDPMAEARKQITGAIKGEPLQAQPPHREEGVSKDEGAPGASFETRPSAAPQDEAFETRPSAAPQDEAFETRPSAAPPDEDSGLPPAEQADSSKKAAT